MNQVVKRTGRARIAEGRGRAFDEHRHLNSPPIRWGLATSPSSSVDGGQPHFVPLSIGPRGLPIVLPHVVWVELNHVFHTSSVMPRLVAGNGRGLYQPRRVFV